MPKPGWTRRNALPFSAEKFSSGWIFSPRPVASAGLSCRKNGMSEPREAAISLSFSGESGFLKSSLSASRVVAALPLPPPSPAARGILFHRSIATPSLIFAAERKFSAARKTRFFEFTGNLLSLHESWIPFPPRSKKSSSQKFTGCMMVSSSWNPSARLPRMFSSKLTLQGDFFLRRLCIYKRKTRRRKFAGALRKLILATSIVKYAETAAGNERGDIAAAEAHVSVGVEQFG